MSFENDLAAAMAKHPGVHPTTIVSECHRAAAVEAERVRQEHISAELEQSARALAEHEARNAPADDYARALADVVASEQRLREMGITLDSPRASVATTASGAKKIRLKSTAQLAQFCALRSAWVHGGRLREGAEFAALSRFVRAFGGDL